MRVLELFGGIGACTQALKRLGIDFEVVDYVDNDKYAVKSYNAINGTNYEPQDITKWDKDIHADLIMHGSPCQDFSLAGQQAGGDEGSGTRSSLMYETIRIVKKLLPKYVIWENVKNILSKKHRHNFENYLKELRNLGYVNYYQVLNAKDYGIPQNRERVFTVSIRRDVITEDNQLKDYKFPEKQELKLRLKDLLEDEVDEKYYLSDSSIKNLQRDFGSKAKEVNREGICDTLQATMGIGGGNTPIIKIKNANSKGYDEAIEGDSIDLTYPNSTTRRGRVGHQVSQTIPASDTKGVVVPQYNNLRIRKLTPKECWRLMGFSDEAFEKAQQVNSNTQLYKQAGNSIVVNVLVEIFRNLLEN